MKFSFSLCFLVLVGFCFSAHAQQNIQSFIDVSCGNGKCRVSGVVKYEVTKSFVISRLTQRLGEKTNFNNVRIVPSAVYFEQNWESGFEPFVERIRTDINGLYSFRSKMPDDPALYPELPVALRHKTLQFLDGRISAIGDLGSGPIVLTLLEPWAVPATRQIPVLNSINQRSAARGVRVIGISTDNQPRSHLELSKYAERHQIRFEIAWADEETAELFSRISKFSGIPQSLVVFKGRLRGVFIGSSNTVSTKLSEVVASLAMGENEE